MAADLATMKARIASELHRDDMATQIDAAIRSSIRQYRSRNFEFADAESTFNTANGTAAYVPATDVAVINSLIATVNGRLYPLDEMNWPEYEANYSSSTVRGQPYYFARYNGQVYLWPTPNAAYPITFRYQQRKAEPVADSDVTVWTDQAEELIRQSAKKRVCRDVLRDIDGFQAAEAAEKEALNVLHVEALQLQDEGGLSPSWL